MVKNKNRLQLLMLFISISLAVHSQERLNPILTGAAFLRIPPDARAGGLADMGVATSSDAFSQYWNSAKYVFSKEFSAIGVSYTPYLSEITNDVFLMNLSGYSFINEEQRATIGASIYYFSLGDIELTKLTSNGLYVSEGTAKPSEFAIDLSYGMKLSDYYAMAVALRYIRSDLFNGIEGQVAASSFGVDISGIYESGIVTVMGKDGRIRAGFNISNIGPKLDYSNDEDKSNYLPSNLRLGAGYDFVFNEDNQLTIGLELNKLLVPTPTFEADGTRVVKNLGVLESVFSSLGDGEDLKEITWAISAEYLFNQAFAFRLGYFSEHELKGARQFFSTGVGLKYDAFGFDAAYLFSTNKNVNNALQNTLRFGLTWDIGGAVR